MINQKTTFILIIILLLVSIGFTQDKSDVPDQPKSTAPGTRVERNAVAKTTETAFVDSLRTAKKPGGIVLSRVICGVEAIEPQFELESGATETILNSIVRQDPQYAWSIDNGVINLIPANEEPAFLKVRIENFQIEGSINTSMALEKLLRLPIVESASAEINLNKGLMYGGLNSPRSAQMLSSLNLKNITVRQALNEIVKRDGRAVWRYSESDCAGKRGATLDLTVR